MIETQLRQYLSQSGSVLNADAFTSLVRYAELITKWNRITNLVASASADELAHAHIIDCLAAVPYIDGEHIADVGSGAGLPGIVIAIMRPNSRLTLVESRQRKSRFLRQAAIELELANVDVVAQRIEAWRPHTEVDCCVCRGYSSLHKFYTDTRALHHSNCRLVALKGIHDEADIAGIPVAQGLIEVIKLDVPGWTHRELVTIECGQ